MKTFRFSPQNKGKKSLGNHNGNTSTATATTISVQSNFSTIGEDHGEMPPFPNHGSPKQQTRLGGASPKRNLMKMLRQSNGLTKEATILEARQRAAKRLEPPPFSPSNLDRLHELKEAKLRAEERREERIVRSNSGETSSVVSNPNDPIDGSGDISLSEQSHSEEDLSLVQVRKDASIFLTSSALHMLLLVPLLRHASSWCLPPLLMIALQSLSLYGLLNSILVYSFDNIDFGQMVLVKNMDYGKKLFVAEVRRYSLVIAASVGVGSVGCGLGGWMIGTLKYGMCFIMNNFWKNSALCGDIVSTEAATSWAYQAFLLSSFLSSRLGVFVLAFLFLGHLLLPKPQKDTNSGNAVGIVAGGSPSNDGRQRHISKLKKKPTIAVASFGASFLLAAIMIAPVSSDSNNASPVSSSTRSQNAVQSILVAGSLNADTFLPIHRFPSSGENLTLLPDQHPMVDVPGGKGCNQAIACAKLSSGANKKIKGVAFLGQFGNDSASSILKNALMDNGVDISACGHSKQYPSGRGYVMIVPHTGEVSAVVSGGSNLYGWKSWGVDNENEIEPILADGQIQDIVSSHSLLLLQCEIPHLVNLRLAKAARELGVPVIVDVGGEDRKMERDLLECCDYLVPNETELERLAASYKEGDGNNNDDEMVGYGMVPQHEMAEIQSQIGPTLHIPSILKSVATLQRNGASNVLVTLGSNGSILVKKNKQVLYQTSCGLPSGATVVDETGAGDCYRAGFSVALLEHCGGGNDSEDVILQKCMMFASAAGALAVTRKGAVPSIPSRREVEELLLLSIESGSTKHDAFGGQEVGSATSSTVEAVPRGGNNDNDNFPFFFGSRINSMKDRLDLVDPSSLPMATPRDYLKRQATIQGLGCVDFNYPQHFGDFWTPEEAKAALDEVNLIAGAVCLRYPSKFARGAMNHPDLEMRREAIEITKQAAEAAMVLGCKEVVVWSAFDGYDYPFQVDYQEKWDQIVEAFQECCDAYPDIKWSLEFKPTDENTRFFTVPSTGAAMLLVKQIDRPNMGLTLDMGHMLMSGENPGQSIAMVGEKLFGIQLNDGYTRLAAEDGMMFGSIHPSIALEAMYQLRQIDFKGHLYFDTFPQRTDPVKEAEYNIRRVKEFWRAAAAMDGNEVERIAKEHDAIGALELVNEALRRS